MIGREKNIASTLSSDSLVEVNVPLSNDHFEAHEKWKQRVNGKTVIDCLFHNWHISPMNILKQFEMNCQMLILFFFHTHGFIQLQKGYYVRTSNW